LQFEPIGIRRHQNQPHAKDPSKRSEIAQSHLAFRRAILMRLQEPQKRLNTILWANLLICWPTEIRTWLASLVFPTASASVLSPLAG